jgi:hypothetical protein
MPSFTTALCQTDLKKCVYARRYKARNELSSRSCSQTKDQAIAVLINIVPPWMTNEAGINSFVSCWLALCRSITRPDGFFLEPRPKELVSLKMSKESTLVTPHHHTSISDRDGEERKNQRPNGDVCSEQTFEWCRCLVPFVAHSIDDRAIVFVNIEEDGRRWLKFTFDFLCLTSRANTKRKQKQFLSFPLGLTWTSCEAAHTENRIYSRARCNRRAEAFGRRRKK